MNQEIKKFRRRIDKIDKLILEKLSERLTMARLIGRIKKISDQPVSDQAREMELAELHGRWAGEFGLDAKFVKKLFAIIIKEAKKIQI